MKRWQEAKRQAGLVSFGGLLTIGPAGLLQAESSRNIFQHGFAAASYGDLLLEKGSLRKEDLLGLRLRAGVQLFSLGPVGLSLGYQKTGFYTASYSPSRDSGAFQYDYRGPVLELHVLPSSLFSLSLAGSTNKGFIYRQEEDPSLLSYGCGEGCQALAERSEVSVGEYSVHVGVRVARQMQLSLGFGTRQLEAKSVAYQTTQSKGSGTEFVVDPAQNWREKGSFVTFGLRGTTL